MSGQPIGLLLTLTYASPASTTIETGQPLGILIGLTYASATIETPLTVAASLTTPTIISGNAVAVPVTAVAVAAFSTAGTSPSGGANVVLPQFVRDDSGSTGDGAVAEFAGAEGTITFYGSGQPDASVTIYAPSVTAGGESAVQRIDVTVSSLLPEISISANVFASSIIASVDAAAPNIDGGASVFASADAVAVLFTAAPTLFGGAAIKVPAVAVAVVEPIAIAGSGVLIAVPLTAVVASFGGGSTGDVLREDGSYVLREDGSKVVLEASASVGPIISVGSRVPLPSIAALASRFAPIIDAGSDTNVPLLSVAVGKPSPAICAGSDIQIPADVAAAVANYVPTIYGGAAVKDVAAVVLVTAPSPTFLCGVFIGPARIAVTVNRPSAEIDSRSLRTVIQAIAS